MVRKRLGVALGAVLVLIPGCSAPAAFPSTPSSSTPVSPAPDPGNAVQQCTSDAAAAIDGTVTAQLAAFSAGDYAKALALASDSFRSTIGEEDFRVLIMENYPEVAKAVDHRLDDCRQTAPSMAFATISVQGVNGDTARLAYRFVLEDGQWRVDGASTIATDVVQNA